MAYFRCGGSGIPASLKSGMNSVLNKKFGTSTTYDPSGWPDDVNLMGPLPIKSASGAIASFSDGADGVPVKSCVVSFLPSGGGGTPQNPISVQGVSSLTVTNKDDLVNPTHTDTYTDTFGQTIYGGTRDLTTDKASVTSSGKIKFNDDSLTWTYQSSYSRFRCTSLSSVIKKPASNTTALVGLIASCYVTGVASTGSASPLSIACDNTGGLIVYDSNYTDVTTWLNNIGNEEFVYPLATPTEITGLTPHEIDTLLGDNNIYADTGTMSVEYRADIDLALNA